MKIETVKISKFRSIDSGNFCFNEITAIVGQNNSGKSAIMRALNSFFNPSLELGSYTDGTNLYTTKRSIPRITIDFISVPTKAIYTPFIFNNKLVIRQEFNKKQNRLDYHVWDNTKFQVAGDQLINEILSDIQFVLIPTERNMKNDDENEIGILKKLLDTFFSTHTANQDRLSPKVKDAFNYLKKNALNKVSKGIEGKYLASKGITIAIDSMFNINYELFINDLAIKVLEEGKEFSLEECGSGVQSLIAISIYRYLAELNNINYVIGIEEPEINLHPQAQKDLIFELLDEVRQGLQVIFTTHSTVLIDELDHTKIVLVRKEKDEKRKFKSTIHQVNSDFWNLYNLGRIQYDKFHKFKNSEFFFANHVMVTESPTDSEVFRKLLKNKGIEIERFGISVLELSGITSLKYAFYLLRDLQIPKTMIIDKDFFFNYKNGSKVNSRYGNGFFNYNSTFKNETLITEILNIPSKKTILEGMLTTNYSKALDELLNFDVICMRFNLEMDLVASTNACSLIYTKLNIPAVNQNTHYLLTTKEGDLKKLDVLLHIINNLPQTNLPNSYKRVIRRFREIIK